MAQTRGANFTDGQGYILITGAPTNVVTGATDDEGLYPDFTEVAAGSILRVDGTNALYEVATVDALSSPPSLTLTVNFPTNVNTDTWSITNDFTLNLNLPRANQTDTYFADINWRQMQIIDNFGFVQQHDDLTDMPDTTGINVDHDTRYVAPVQDATPVIPTPYQGMFWYDTDEIFSSVFSHTTITDDYSVLSTDQIILCNNTKNITVTLPEASTVNGKLYRIKNINTGETTVDGYENELIDGGKTAVMNCQYEALTLYCDGSNWNIM